MVERARTREKARFSGIEEEAPYARWHPIVVEETKPAAEQGPYLHPEAYGASTAGRIPTPAVNPAP